MSETCSPLSAFYLSWVLIIIRATFLIYIFLLVEKVGEGFRRLLTPNRFRKPHSTKKFHFHGSPFVFSNFQRFKNVARIPNNRQAPFPEPAMINVRWKKNSRAWNGFIPLSCVGNVGNDYSVKLFFRGNHCFLFLTNISTHF